MDQGLKTVAFDFYDKKYSNQLKEPLCLPNCLTELCSGWYQETFKQIMNILSKNQTAPLPLYFPTPEAMDSISNNKKALKEVFQAMDTRGIGRIDAMELYTVFLFISKADFKTVLKCIVDIFGTEEVGFITKGELFFFIDSLFRGFAKFLITRYEAKPSTRNVRLDFIEINSMINKLIVGKNLARNDIQTAFEGLPSLFNFLKYVHSRIASSAEYAREITIKHMKIEPEVKALMRTFYDEIERRLKQTKST